ncbi:MAG: rhomboid family intramembrane serine protease [Anaerolineae bacterium]|nr:MAG: rhomboid family intramembrane serine protease [Anaerolineae bacterium]
MSDDPNRENETLTPLPDPGDESQSQPPEIRVPVARVAVRLPGGPPFVTYSIIGLTVVVYLFQMLSTFVLGGDLPLALGAKINEYMLDGQWWRFITPVLLHGSVLHIGVNMYSLYAIGPQLEPFYGHWRFLALYLLTAFTGVVLSFALSDGASVGASTAIFGLLGALGVFAYLNRGVFGQRAQLLLRNVVQVAVINLIIGLTPGIDNWGHAGGLVGGVLLAWLGGPEFRLAGEPPELRLENQRSNGVFAMSALGVFILFAAIAIFVMI